jgi:hypothetical protein
MWEVVSERGMERTEVRGKPHEPQGEGVDGGFCGPLIGGLPCLPQTFEDKMLDIVGKAGGSQLTFVPSVVFGHHDEGHPKILQDG